MFNPTLHLGANTNHLIEVNNSVAAAYLHSLREVHLSDVSLLELFHTLFKNTAVVTAEALDQYVEEVNDAVGYYRDAAGTLVVRHNNGHRDRLSLLWPVARPVDNPTKTTTIRGSGNEVFVGASGVGEIVPLAAATADRYPYSWGYTGTGPLNLYMALVYAVEAKEPPIPPPPLHEHPRSLYGWLTNQDQNAELRLRWSELVRRVDDDRPIRAAVVRAKNRPTVPEQEQSP